MAVRLKKIDEQVVVVTGASSGIGLATARLAAERGARVVVVGRDERQLAALVEELRGERGEAAFAVADVADFGAMQQVAATAVREFGGIDTWINNAGVSIYGRLVDTPLEDARRLFETNYWGVVIGSRIAVAHLREQGGALINVGSTLSERSIPLQGHYAASKHAVKAFTDALRMELEKDEVPVSVTLVKPGSIDTPFTEHARNFMEVEPKLPPPVYAPEVVARTILECAERPVRDIFVGGGGKMTAALESVPATADRVLRGLMFDGQQRETPAPADRPDALYEPQPGSERGDHEGRVMKRSAYTAAALHPVRALLGVAAVSAGVALARRALHRE